jgi:hypothetical protein
MFECPGQQFGNSQNLAKMFEYLSKSLTERRLQRWNETVLVSDPFEITYITVDTSLSTRKIF